MAAKLFGVSTAQLVKDFRAPDRSTMNKIVKRAQTTKTTETADRKKGNFKASFRDERRLCFLAAKYPEYSYSRLAKDADLPISGKTVKRIVYCYQLNKLRKTKRILLTDDDACERLKFCRYWLANRARLEELMRALFTDECTVQNHPFNPGQFVTRLSLQRYEKWAVEPTAHFGPRISQMVWGALWMRGGEAGLGKLVFCKGDPDAQHQGVSARSYLQVLKEGLLPFYEGGDPFMQDNARIHTSQAVKDWLELHGIWTIKWPSHSPDLNPIEHIWKELKRQIHELEPNFAGLKDNIAHQAHARRVIAEAWSNIPDVRVKVDGVNPSQIESL